MPGTPMMPGTPTPDGPLGLDAEVTRPGTPTIVATGIGKTKHNGARCTGGGGTPRDGWSSVMMMMSPLTLMWGRWVASASLPGRWSFRPSGSGGCSCKDHDQVSKALEAAAARARWTVREDSEDGLVFEAPDDDCDTETEGDALGGGAGSNVAPESRVELAREVSSESECDANSFLTLGAEVVDTGITAPCGWRPGWSVGEWVCRRQPLAAQGQVLVANTLLALSRVPRKLLRAITDYLQPDNTNIASLILRAASGALRLSAYRIVDTISTLQGRGWAPRVDNKALSYEGVDRTVPSLAGGGRQQGCVALAGALFHRHPLFKRFTGRLRGPGVEVGERGRSSRRSAPHVPLLRGCYLSCCACRAMPHRRRCPLAAAGFGHCKFFCLLVRRRPTWRGEHEWQAWKHDSDLLQPGQQPHIATPLKAHRLVLSRRGP